MAAKNLENLASIDAQLRLLVPKKLSEDDKLVEYDALLLDRFLDILQDLHGQDLRETVQECYELSAEYEGKQDPKTLEELGRVLTGLDPGDSIVLAKSFSHMLNLANLAEEVQIAYRRRIKSKKGDFADENSAATESDIEETFKRLVLELKKSPEEVFDALKNQTVDLVLTAHPTQSIRRSLLQKHARIRNCLTQLYAKDITPDDKQELDEALQREGQFRGRTEIAPDQREKFLQRLQQVQQQGHSNLLGMPSLAGANHKQFAAQPQNPLMPQFTSQSLPSSPQVGLGLGVPASSLNTVTSTTLQLQQQPNSIHQQSSQQAITSGQKEAGTQHPHWPSKKSKCCIGFISINF